MTVRESGEALVAEDDHVSVQGAILAALTAFLANADGLFSELIDDVIEPLTLLVRPTFRPVPWHREGLEGEFADLLLDREQLVIRECRCNSLMAGSYQRQPTVPDVELEVFRPSVRPESGYEVIRCVAVAPSPQTSRHRLRALGHDAKRTWRPGGPNRDA